MLSFIVLTISWTFFKLSNLFSYIAFLQAFSVVEVGVLEQHKKPVGVEIVLCFPYQFDILIELWKLSILCPFENKESLNLHQFLIILLLPSMIVYEFIFIFHALIIGINTLLYLQCQSFFHKYLGHCIIFRSFLWVLLILILLINFIFCNLETCWL